MTDDLRTRIAAALYDHWWHGTTTLKEPPRWEKLSGSAQEDWLRQADAVIEKERNQWAGGGAYRYRRT